MTIRIHRSEDAGWTKLANVMLRDSNLTLRAKGLLAQLLSHEDGWQQSLAYAEKQCDDGRHVVAAAFGELMSAGYATRARAKDHTGKFRGWDYDIYDTPVPAETSRSTVIGNTVIGNTDIGESGTLEEPQPLEEPLEQKNPEVALAPTSSSRRDLHFEALFALNTGTPYTSDSQITKRESTQIGVAAAALRQAGATPEQILASADAWAELYPNATWTPHAAVSHWSKLVAIMERGYVSRGERKPEKAGDRMLRELREDAARSADVEEMKQVLEQVEREEARGA